MLKPLGEYVRDDPRERRVQLLWRYECELTTLLPSGFQTQEWEGIEGECLAFAAALSGREKSSLVMTMLQKGSSSIRYFDSDYPIGTLWMGSSASEIRLPYCFHFAWHAGNDMWVSLIMGFI